MAAGEDHADGTVEAEGGDSHADMSRRLEEAEQKVKENWDLFLRTRADLENYRRRVDRDLPGTLRRAKAELLGRFLTVADALDRAAEWEEPSGGALAGPGSAGPNAAEGLGRIRRLFLKALADEGVLPIECLGQPFDPTVHEAVAVDADPEVAPDTITAELQRGYTYGDEVLRPARVRVARPPQD